MVNFKASVLLLPFLTRAAPTYDAVSTDLEPLLEDAPTPVMDEFPGDKVQARDAEGDDDGRYVVDEKYLTDNVSRLKARLEPCKPMKNNINCAIILHLQPNEICHDDQKHMYRCGTLIKASNKGQAPEAKNSTGTDKDVKSTKERILSQLTSPRCYDKDENIYTCLYPIKSVKNNTGAEPEAAPLIEDTTIEEPGLDATQEKAEGPGTDGTIAANASHPTPQSACGRRGRCPVNHRLVICHDNFGQLRKCGPLIDPSSGPRHGGPHHGGPGGFRNGTLKNITRIISGSNKRHQPTATPILEDLVIKEQGLETVEEEDEESEEGNAAETINRRVVTPLIAPERDGAAILRKKILLCHDNYGHRRECGRIIPGDNKPVRRVTFSDVIEYAPDSNDEEATPTKRFEPLQAEAESLLFKDEEFDADDESD
ncbi:hypothetical protein VHEMI03107 [[Torrubiella] hemipterigena]|uniref:Uncharacterized protein n=1 Tax=[Torrubiella] hemipterigena TaxID=1531966 RepID=A0A0A1SXM3_9HYPO|nr:hypothetical protein VHEMI03107 [[Torrubiella] hemipterigena]